MEWCGARHRCDFLLISTWLLSRFVLLMTSPFRIADHQASAVLMTRRKIGIQITSAFPVSRETSYEELRLSALSSHMLSKSVED